MNPRFHVPLDDALAEATAYAELARAARRAEEARTRLGLAGSYVSFWRRWEWQVVDVTTGTDLPTGRALTEWGMRRRRYAAYLREVDRIAADGRAES